MVKCINRAYKSNPYYVYTATLNSYSACDIILLQNRLTELFLGELQCHKTG